MKGLLVSQRALLFVITILIVLSDWGISQAWHWEPELVDGKVRVGANSFTTDYLRIGSAVAQMNTACGFYRSAADIELTNEVFLLSVSMEAPPAIPPECRPNTYMNGTLRMRLVSDPGDGPEAYVNVFYKAELSGSTDYIWAQGNLDVENTFDMDLSYSDVLPVYKRHMYGPFLSNAIFEVFGSLDEVPGPGYAQWTMDAGNEFTNLTYSITATIVECGDNSEECPMQTMLMIYGNDMEKVAYSTEMFSEATLKFWGNGWFVDQLFDPTKEDLLSRLENDTCVTGFYILAHGAENIQSVLKIRLNSGGIGVISPFEIGQRTSGRRMGSVTGIACNQVESQWQQSFSSAIQTTLPRYTFNSLAGTGTYALSDWEFMAMQEEDWGIQGLPCPAVEKSNVEEIPSKMLEVRSSSGGCPSFLVCEDGLCGQDLYPALTCTTVIADIPSSQVGISLPDNSASIDFNFYSASLDSFNFGLTRFSLVPPGFIPEGKQSIPYHLLTSKTNQSSSLRLRDIDARISYSDSILNACGVRDENSIGVIWIGQSHGFELAAVVDTVSNEVSFTMPDVGFACLFGLFDVSHAEESLPVFINLDNAYPNPFNPSTTIAFDLPKRSSVSLRVFDVSGRLVRTLIDAETYETGRHEAVWNGRDDSGRQCASGTYFYHLEAGQYSETKRMVLVK